MRKILLVVVLLWFSNPAQGTPLTWHFFGVTNSLSQYNGASIAGLNYELRVFLDTDLVGVKPPALSDVIFSGPHQGEIEIAGLGVLPINMFNNVQYFAPGGLVTGVQFTQPFFSDIGFASSISSDSMHLTPIAPVAPNRGGLDIQGPNGLNARGGVSVFSATTGTTSVPEGGTTAGMLFAGFVALASLGLTGFGRTPVSP